MTGSPGSTSSGPWKPSQKYVKETFGAAKQLYDSGAGFKAPGFSTVTPFSSQTKSALGGMWGQANQGNPLAGQSQGAIGGILGSGGGINTEGDLRGLLANSGNDAWQGAVDTQAGKLTDDIGRDFSNSGRFGSAAHSGAIAQQVGDFRQQALASHFDQNIANQRGILGDITQGQQGNVANQLGAAAAAPGAYEQSYLPYEHQAQVGAAYDDLATRQKQARIDKFNTNQQAGWNRLGAYSNMVGGPGQGSQQTQTAARNPLGGAAGGALLGYQASGGNPYGALVGGGAGLLAQYF